MSPSVSTLGNMVITCTSCRHQIEQPLAWVQLHRVFRCPHCDGYIRLDAAAVTQAVTAPAGGVAGTRNQ